MGKYIPIHLTLSLPFTTIVMLMYYSLYFKQYAHRSECFYLRNVLETVQITVPKLYVLLFLMIRLIHWQWHQVPWGICTTLTLYVRKPFISPPINQIYYCSLWHDAFKVKPVLSGHSKRRSKIAFQDQLSLNAGQKYCRILSWSAFCNTFDLY